MRPGRFSSLRAAQYRHLRVESTPISWEDGSS